ncbi:hypothetical protein Tco_0054654, partial [Tanacetum coccineum]
MSFETSDSSLEELADELAHIESFPPENDDISFDAEFDLRELEYLLNRDPSIDSSPKNNIEEINSILEDFVDEAILVDFVPSDADDDLFDCENDNDEWRNILYHDPFEIVTPPPASKQLSLREVEVFDPFFPLTQS